MSRPHGRRTEVCVVGAGIMGLSATYQLARRGKNVVCIDRAAPGRAATGSTAGTLAIQNKRLGSIPIALRALEMWRGLSEELDFDVEYEVRGGVRVAHTSGDVEKLEAGAEAQRSLGAPVEMVYPPELFRLAPYLSRDLAAGSFCPDDGMGNPFAAVRAYLKACRGTGLVDFQLGVCVERIEPFGEDLFLVHADEQRIECDVVLLAAGAWIPWLLEPLGIEVPLFTQIQQVLVTDFGPPLFPHIVTHAGGNLTVKQQSVTGKVLVGGAWPGEGSLAEKEHHLVRDSVVGNAHRAVSTVPGLAERRLLRGWTGFEGRSPDRLPIIGSVGSPRRLYVLGCAAGGFTLAPICGLLAAQMIVGEEPDVPYEDYLISRFLEDRQSEAPEEETTEGRVG